jgi:hypothetical protein
MKTIARVKVPGDRELEGVWLDRVRRWKASGATGSAFAKAEHIQLQRLHYWSSRFKKAGVDLEGGSASAISTALPVLVTGARVEAGLELQVGAVTICVREGFNGPLLRAVVRALEGSS